MKSIETGVDKLVGLIAEKKRLSVAQAAKDLGVSKVLVQEWADFLEEDGVISIEYSLSNVYLVERKLSKKEVVKKEKEYEAKKDSFVRKVETTLQSIDRDTLGFDKLKGEFDSLQKQIKGEMAFVQKEIKELEYYEDLKKRIDKDVEQQKVEYERMMNQSHIEIKAEERRYQEMIAQISRERQKVVRERQELLTLEQKEKELVARIGELNNVVGVIRKQLSVENQDLQVNATNIEKLERFALQVESRLKNKKHDALLPLLQMSEEHRAKIVHLQEQMIEKLQKRKSEISEVKGQSTKEFASLKRFFEKKEAAEKLLARIERERKVLAQEYDDLIKKAQAFNAISKKETVKKHILDLDKQYVGLEEKRKKLRTDLAELSSLVKK